MPIVSQTIETEVERYTYQTHAMSPQGILLTILSVSRAAVTQMTLDLAACALLSDFSSFGPARLFIR